MAQRDRTPVCPVCRYDQSGIIASWVRECPLAGSCSECGGEIDWSEVHRPELFEERHFFEHPRAAFPRDLLLTLRRTYHPGRFWAWAPRSQPLKHRRLAAVVAAGLLTGLVVPGLFVAGVCAALLAWSYAGLKAQNPNTGSPLWSWQFNGMPSLRGVGTLGLGALGVGITATIVAATWAILARSRGVDLRHILRAGVYITLPVLPLIVVDMLVYGSMLLLDYDWRRFSRLEPIVENYALILLVVGLLAVAWMWRAWAMFMIRYLRARRPRLTALAYGIITALLFPWLITGVLSFFP